MVYVIYYITAIIKKSKHKNPLIVFTVYKIDSVKNILTLNKSLSFECF